MQLGERIRRLRLGQRLTLEQVAQACGCTRSLLSKIENGRSTPPLATLMRIAQALGVQPGSLLEDGGADRTVVDRASERAAQVLTDGGYRYAALAAARGDRRMQPFLFSARRGEVRRHVLRHPGEEFLFVLEGSMRYRVGGREFHLGPGDALYFDAEEEHALEPLSDEVRYLGVFLDPAAATPPPTPRRRRKESP